MASEFETGQSQRDVRLVIPAGGTVNPNYRGEFVFVKDAARAVVVTIHEQEIEMESGDIRRVTSPFDKFSIRNDGAVSAEVRLVVGFGNYNRLIVQGEMNVSAYVRSSGNGVSSALPDKITKEVGLDNNNEVTLSAGTVVTTSPDVAGTNARAVFYWDDEFYALVETRLYKLDKVNDLAFAETIVVSPSLPTDVEGAAINTRGEIFAQCGGQIYKIGLDGTNFGVVKNMGGLLDGVGGGSIGDLVYFTILIEFGPPLDNWAVFEYNTITGESRTVGSTVNRGQVLMVRDGVLYRTTFGSGDGYIVDLDTLVVSDVLTNGVGIGSQNQTAFSAMEDLAATANYGLAQNFSVRNASDVTHYGKIWVQEVGDATTRRYLALLEEYIWYPRNGKTVMVGNVLKAILAATERAYDINYLDRIVSISYFDGLNTHLISSGTQSWALRGLEDELQLALDSEITIEILPPF